MKIGNRCGSSPGFLPGPRVPARIPLPFVRLPLAAHSPAEAAASPRLAPGAGTGREGADRAGAARGGAPLRAAVLFPGSARP